MIGRSGERGSGISVLAARHDDDDDSRRNTRGKKGLPGISIMHGGVGRWILQNI